MPVPATEERRFRFAQWEFPGRLGAPAGRYVVRRFAGDKVRFVIVVTEVPPSRRRRREPVAATRVTVVAAAALRGDATGCGWLRTAAVGEEFEIFARFMAYHRVASADPFAPDADPARALVIRLGYGSGAQLAAGEWPEVRSVDVPVRERAAKRRSKHRPADRLAALLSGRDAVLACE